LRIMKREAAWNIMVKSCQMTTNEAIRFIFFVLNHSFITYPWCTHLSQTNHAIEWHLVSQSASCLADSSNASPAKNGAKTSLRPLRRRAPTSVWWIEPRIAVSNKCFHTIASGIEN
jgi:hypothetical protein